MIGFTKDILDFSGGQMRKDFPGRGNSPSKKKRHGSVKNTGEIQCS